MCPATGSRRWGGTQAVILALVALFMTSRTNALDAPQKSPSTLAAWALLAAIFAAVILASLFTPPLLDDVDASHAQAAQHMAESGDWVTLKVNGIRYLEKPPLPYWLDAGALSRLWPECLCHSPAQCAGSAGLRLAGLAVGRPRLGTPRRPLRRAGRADLRSGRFSLPASPFPRRC